MQHIDDAKMTWSLGHSLKVLTEPHPTVWIDVPCVTHCLLMNRQQWLTSNHALSTMWLLYTNPAVPFHWLGRCQHGRGRVEHLTNIDNINRRARGTLGMCLWEWMWQELCFCENWKWRNALVVALLVSSVLVFVKRPSVGVTSITVMWKVVKFPRPVHWLLPRVCHPCSVLSRSFWSGYKLRPGFFLFSSLVLRLCFGESSVKCFTLYKMQQLLKLCWH